MAIIMIQNIINTTSLMDFSSIYQLFIGILASLVAWWAVNSLLVPNFHMSDLSFDNKYRPYVKIWNRSWHRLAAYDIKCNIVYYKKNNTKYPFFSRDDISKPILVQGTNNSNYEIIKLGGDERLKNFFSNGNVLIITIVGQNKFGVRQAMKKKIVIDNPYLKQ